MAWSVSISRLDNLSSNFRNWAADYLVAYHNHLTTIINRGKVKWYTKLNMQDGKEEVRDKLNIEDVIGEYVDLKRAGRNFKGLSPFTGEKTPSFFVSPEKQIWHDFSANRGGDVFSFVMEAEGMDFRQALEHLARKAGVDLAQYQSKSSQQLAHKKQRLLKAHDLAAKYFMASLVKNQRAIDYVFKQRRLSRQVVEDFRIGYAPDSGQALKDFLTKKGFSPRELSDAGLVNRYGGDLFRGRMTVPLMDPSGQVIGFTGRIIGQVENAPKYLNTPQTLIYDKGRHVFGLSQAKQAIRSAGYAVIVEGNLDVVSSHQVDIRQVVATAGTAITENHLRALKRLSGDIRLAFDGDKAGLAAAERAVEIASGLGLDISIITLPGDAKDPDELIQQDPKLWRQAIDNTTPAADWVLDQYAQRYDLKTGDGKRKFSSAAASFLRRIEDPVEREHYEKKAADQADISLEVLRSKLAEQTLEPTRKKSVAQLGTADKTELYQDDLLAAASLDPTSQELLAGVDSQLFSGEQRQALAEYFSKNHQSALKDTPKQLQEFDTYVKIVLLRADTRYATWSEKDLYFEVARLIRQLENEKRKQKRSKLIEKLRTVEAEGDESLAEELRAELNKLIKEIARAER